ncbi:MAG: preprotein translocase subunit SecF [candidate division TA06 bacterium ADurb.Bin417]|uniref:Protein-export membrane protein SecF n=1 Tax=candidate division TA06 bacterium ADurb.Bin417 TaxID=1852828 RepID=A0A1V5MIY0_UNCT6|nr:MAG: preprotein translocase subunit SecF [candidate division TA06 bacterium ADurb.Bin417]
MNFFPKTTNFDFMGKRGIFFILSLVITIVGLALTFIRGGRILSMDFTGGYLTQLEFSQEIDISQIRGVLSERGYDDILLQKVGETGRRFIIKTKQGGHEIIQTLRESFPAASINILSEEQVSPTMGQTIRKQTLIACLLAICGILIYVAFRFEFRFAVAATIAIVHDLLVTLAFVVVSGREIDSLVIAAFLTILGYSVNDTVVIFDRIRENLRGLTRVSDPVEVFNRSLNETLSRTLITGVTTLFTLGCLYFLGGPVLNTFAFTLIVGIITGTYSSIFIASAIVIAWEKRAPHRFRTSSS